VTPLFLGVVWLLIVLSCFVFLEVEGQDEAP
jgi:hypothetical protein